MKKGRKEGLNILFTCAGRRVALIEAFKKAAKNIRIKLTTFATDINPLSPALYISDKKFIAPKILSNKYIDFIIEISRKYKIDLIIPTIDTELFILAQNKEKIKKEAGTIALVSNPDVIEICQDKRKTYNFLKNNGFGTPWTALPEEISSGDLKLPVFLKPWDGSASRGNAKASTTEEYQYYIKKIPNCIVQEYIDGQEYTCDVYVDFNMNVRTVVPRQRIEIRAGEVSKARTVKDLSLIEECRRLIDTLRAGPGVITIQCFITKDNKIRFIEINPRFGGGVPLSIKAGANFPKWIMQEALNRPINAKLTDWEENIYMLRYDEAVWIKKPIAPEDK